MCVSPSLIACPPVASPPRSVSRERVIAAEPQPIFDVLADPRKHPIIDGSDSVKRAIRGPARLSLGAHFGMAMRIGMPYVIRNTVMVFEEGRRIGWWHLGHNLWLYELFAMPSGTRVVETFDWSKGRFGNIVEITRFETRNALAMERTLERLDRLVVTGSAD